MRIKKVRRNPDRDDILGDTFKLPPRMSAARTTKKRFSAGQGILQVHLRAVGQVRPARMAA
jgi:hypothetical protein